MRSPTRSKERLLAAHANGVDVSSGWDCRTNGSVPDCETVITELAKRSPDEDEPVEE